MNQQELVRIVDSIARDKNIEREQIYSDIEQAIASGLRKQFNTEDTSEFSVQLDRHTGQISAQRNGKEGAASQEIPLSVVSRIGAQTVKQVMIQLIRADERGSIYDEYKDRVGTIITGTIARFEGGTMIVNLGRAEGIMPRGEQIPGEAHQVGERIQALVLEVRDTPSAIKIILSRSHPELIRRLFEREVPEVGERTIEIKALAREPGHRTKIAVSSIDSKVDAVGACVGVRGSRIKNIVDELGGEKIDIVRWNESSQILIGNALKPAEVAEVALCFELGRATVVVNEDQLSLAIGKRGQNVRLAARLTGWDIDILTPTEFQAGVKRLEETLKQIEGILPEMTDKFLALGLIDVRDIPEVGEEPLMEEIGLDAETAKRAVARCAEEAKLVAVEQHAKKAADASARSAADAERKRSADFFRGLGGTGAAPAGADGAEPAAAGAADPTPGGFGDAGGSDAGGGLDGGAAGNGNAGDSDGADATETGSVETDNRMPGLMEASEGAAPELVVHKEQAVSPSSELSPEEQAIQEVVQGSADGARDHDVPDEESDMTALAEGRAAPPRSGPDEAR